jgi:SAM-dependent methyltransferase
MSTADFSAAHAGVVAEQRALWGTAPRDWAELAERENQPLYEAILAAVSVGPGTRMLDVGCGSGLLCELAEGLGAEVYGIDVTPELLALARERVPGADLREGDMCALPFPDTGFDLVTGVNSFQFAPDPALAFAEAARVLKTGGRLVAAAFAEPERNEGTVVQVAMKSLVTQVQPGGDGYAPYALSAQDGLRTALGDAGLDVTEVNELKVSWRYADRDAALRALLASAGGARAVRAVGRERVIEALIAAIGQFTGEDGKVTMRNLFRYAVGERRR